MSTLLCHHVCIGRFTLQQLPRFHWFEYLESLEVTLSGILCLLIVIYLMFFSRLDWACWFWGDRHNRTKCVFALLISSVMSNSLWVYIDYIFKKYPIVLRWSLLVFFSELYFAKFLLTYSWVHIFIPSLCSVYWWTHQKLSLLHHFLFLSFSLICFFLIAFIFLLTLSIC